MKVTHIRRVKPVNFANWLEKKTKILYSKNFPTQKGTFTLQRASRNGGWNNPNPSKVYINATWVDDSTGQPIFFDDSIVFELVPLDDERTEITSTCANESSPILNYFYELLAEIERLWKAEGTQAATPTPTASAASDATPSEPTAKRVATDKQTSKIGGRPRNIDDEWARTQVHILGRSKQEVFPEWKKRIGERAKKLADIDDSFDKVIGKKPKERE